VKKERDEQPIAKPATRKPYRSPRLTVYGEIHTITGTRSGSGNDLSDGVRLGTEPTK
jgi:hypothetical protein